MLPRRGGQLTIPSPATVRAPGISRRTGAPRTVDPLPSSRIVVLDVDGNPVESIPQEDEVAPETLGQASVPDSTSLTPTGSLSRNSAPVSLPPGYTTALLRGGFAVVCSVCSVGLPKYSCPKCSAPLCSLECYRAPAHGDGCAERFYEGEVRAAMGTARAVPGERDALLRVLQRADAAAAARGEGSISSAHGATGDGDDEDDVPLPEPVPTSVPRRRLAAPAHANAHAPMPASGPGSAPASVAAAEDEGGVGDSPKQQQQQQQQQKQVLPPLSPTAAARLLSLAQAGALTIEALTPHERACFRASETVASVAAPAAATTSDATGSCGADNVSTPADLASVFAAAASGQEETPSADGRSAGIDSSACNRGWWYSRPPQSPLDGPVHGPMPAGSAPVDASKWDLSGDSSNDSVSSLLNVGAPTETTSAACLHNASASGANVASANTVGRIFTVRPPPGAGPIQVWPLPPLPLALVQGQEQQGQECASGARGVGSVRLPWFLPGLPPEWVTAAKDAAAAASAAAAAAAAEAEPGVANSPSEPSAGVMPPSVSGPTLSSVTPRPTAAAAVTAAAAAAGEAAAATVISNYIMDIEFFGTGTPPSTRKAASSAESAAQEQGQQQQQELEAESAPLPPPLPQVVPRLSAVAAGVRVHAPPYPFLPSSQQPESVRAGVAKVEDAAHEGPWLLALPSKYIEHVNSASPHSMFKGQSPRVLSPLLVLHIAELLLAYAHVTRTRSTDEEGGLTLMKGAEAASDVEVLLSVSACIRSALAPVATAPASGENTRANSDRALLAGAGNAAGAAYLFNSACDTIATRTRAAFAAAATASAVAAGGAVTGVVVSGAAAAGAAEATASLFDTAVILSHPLRCLRALAHILGMVTLAAAHVQASSAVSTPVSAPIPAPARAPAPAPPAAAAAPAVTVNSASTPANGVSARSNESSDSHGRGRGRGGRALRGARGGLSSVAEGNARSLAAAQGVLRSSKSAVDVVSVRVRRLERVAQKVEFLMAAVAEHVAATTVPTANRKMPSVTKARGVAVLEEEQESMVGTAKARASDMRGRGCCKGKGCASAAALYQAALTPKALALAQEENRCNTCSLFAPPASSTSGLTAAAAAAVEAVSSDCATIAGLVPVVPLPLGLPFVESLSPNSVAAKAAAAAAGVPLYQQGGALTPLCCKCTRLTNPKMASVVSSPEEVGDGEQGEGLGWLEQADSCQRSSPSVLPPLPLPVIEPVLSAAAAAAATEAEATAMDRTADAGIVAGEGGWCPGLWTKAREDPFFGTAELVLALWKVRVSRDIPSITSYAFP